MANSQPSPEPTPPPDALLSPVQASQWSDQPLAEIQRLMSQGLLRHEIVRQGEREVQRIRFVDLCESFPAWNDRTPDADHAPLEAETPSGLTPPAEKPERDKAAPEGEMLESTISSGHHIAVPDADWKRGLQALVQTQEDLREQCYELRQRVAEAEEQRNRTAEVLLQNQAHWERKWQALTSTPWWKRPATWAALAALLVSLGFLRSEMGSVQAAIQNDQATWAESVQADATKRLSFQASRSQAEQRVLLGRLTDWSTELEQWRAEQTRLDSEERAKLDDQRQVELAQQKAQQQELAEEQKRQFSAALSGLQGQLKAFETQALGALQKTESNQAKNATWRKEWEQSWQAREKRALEANAALLQRIQDLQSSDEARSRDAERLMQEVQQLRTERERNGREAQQMAQMASNSVLAANWMAGFLW